LSGFTRRIKEKLGLLVYCFPVVRKRAVDQAISTYNITPHESFDDEFPNEVYVGKKEAILKQRKNN